MDRLGAKTQLKADEMHLVNRGQWLPLGVLALVRPYLVGLQLSAGWKLLLILVGPIKDPFNLFRPLALASS